MKQLLLLGLTVSLLAVGCQKKEETKAVSVCRRKVRSGGKHFGRKYRREHAFGGVSAGAFWSLNSHAGGSKRAVFVGRQSSPMSPRSFR